MLKKSLIALLFLLPLCAAAQELLPDSVLAQQTTYTNLNDAVANADRAYKLNLSKRKLKDIPADVFKLKVLQVLILSSNDIKELPQAIGRLKNLQVLDIGKNKLTKLPDSIGQLENLKLLALYRNDVDTLPKTMRNLHKLEKLDLWENSVYFIPDELKELAALKEVDLRGILFNEPQQIHIKKDVFPNAKVLLSPPCTCNF